MERRRRRVRNEQNQMRIDGRARRQTKIGLQCSQQATKHDGGERPPCQKKGRDFDGRNGYEQYSVVAFVKARHKWRKIP